MILKRKISLIKKGEIMNNWQKIINGCLAVIVTLLIYQNQQEIDQMDTTIFYGQNLKIETMDRLDELNAEIDALKTQTAAQTNTTIESCAQSLPSGQTFELELKGKIDTNSLKHSFSGNFGLSDGTEIEYTDSQRERITPFVNCLKSLLK